MFRLLGFVLLIVAGEGVAAEKLVSRIQHIDYAKNPDEQTLLMLETGEVLKISQEQKSLRPFERAQKNKKRMKFTINRKREVIDAEAVDGTQVPFWSSGNAGDIESKEPTVIDLEQANSIFKGLNPNYRSRSQCYNRAHVWALETKEEYDVNLMKLFIFFTRKYIREYDYEWWFHVSPMALVKEGNAVSERVLDYRFIRTPFLVRDWTNVFMRNDAECPVVTSYSAYANNQDSESCYLIKTSMFYYQPLDIKALEEQGKEKTNWVQWEVKNAYRQGFRSSWW